jgi:chloride channel, nucleotide-sensitive, 1A
MLSSKLLLYSTAASLGVAIPYPSISLHAIQSLPQPTPGEQQGLYMQLTSASTDSAEEDMEPDSISVTIVPTASAPPPAATESDPAGHQPEQTPVMAMFTALSNCSNLHPDPIDQEDQDPRQIEGSRLFQAGMIQHGDPGGGLPPPMPGSGGWITSENMHEFVDEDGNWIVGDDEQEAEALGPGAGTVRTREGEEEDDDATDMADETKWRRTS